MARRGLVVHLPAPCAVRRAPFDFRGVVELIQATVELAQEFFEHRAGEPWPELGPVGHLHRPPLHHVPEVAASAG